MFILYIFLVALLMSLVIAANARKLKFATGDGIPQLGGLAIWFSFLFVSLSALILKGGQVFVPKEILGIFICSTIIFVIGLIDDRRELTVSVKLLFQLAITLIVMIFGVRSQIVGIGLYGNMLVTLLWVVGITNAFNHLDIMDGLSAGVAFISSLSFFAFSIITHNIPLAFTFVALAGGILGFLKYNVPEAKIYMGNSGSHFLGFVLSSLAILISYATIEKRIVLIAPILILGFPIFDTIFVVWMRLLKHKPVWLKSNDHLALRLISLGLSKQKVVTYMILLAIIFCVSSIFILYLPYKLGIALLFLLFITCIYIALKIQKIKINE